MLCNYINFNIKMLRFTRLLTNSIELERYIIKRFAGHSKWANIKHIKALKDGQRSAQFTRLGRQMKVAVQEGGSTNPLSNLLLSQVIEQAKRVNMPIASIQSVIKSCESNKNNSKKYRIEIRAAGGAIILCELFTDNIAKIKQNVSTLLRKASFAYADSGAKHVFEHKGLVDTDIPEDLRSKTEEDILEFVTDHAIEVGCDDVSFLNIEDSKMLRFTCDPRHFVRIENQLRTKYNYNILSSCEEFIPVNVVSLSEKDVVACQKFIQKLEDLPEVITVYSNIA